MLGEFGCKGAVYLATTAIPSESGPAEESRDLLLFS